ncbi:MAG: amidohydrolase family protein [Candidatus Aminicenantes bacterium]|nr:amidohydrolase family protein [Candidatus Aminicenantes bacterium]
MFKRWLIIISTLAMMMFSLAGCKSGKFDILVKNGKIIDGTGNPWFYGDIGIIGNKIAEIGDLSRRTAAKTIDAKGLVVSPGFIDMHTHCEEELGRPDANANLNYLIQGTTTVVTGNCGDGTFKIAETKDKWEKQGIGTNAVHLVGFGTVRKSVMGEEPRGATPEELDKIKEIVRQAMMEGAWGMSTGLEYIPGRYATTEEIIDVTRVVGQFGGVYASHQRNEFDRVPESTQETIRIAEEAGVRANVSHFKVCRKDYWGKMKEAVKLINDARTRGVYVVADMYPYHYASGGRILPIARNAGWAPFHLPNDMEPFAELRKKIRDRNLPDSERNKLREQYVDELAKALADKSKREQIRKSVLEGEPHRPSAVALAGWDSYLVTIAEKNKHLVGKILSDIAKEQKRDPFDLAADLAIDEPDLYVACGVMSEDDMKYAMKEDWLMFSSDGDASPILKETDEPRIGHPRAFSSQARVLRKFVREENVLTLENAIKKMTSLPASFLQLKDRGLLIKGYKADIAIFAPETVRDNATHSDSRQYSTGTKYVIVNGKISIENGEYDGALNGKLLLLAENK